MDSFEHFGSSGQASVEFEPEFAAPSQSCLAIVDANRLRRDCLKLVLAQQPRRWQISEFAAASDIGDGRDRFDVILMTAAGTREIDIGDVATLAAAGPLLVATDYDDAEPVRLILRTGARGFAPTSLGLAVLLAALERVRAGGTYVPAMIKASASPVGGIWGGLTRRQREVLALITQGKSNKLIADALAMSEDTVKAHVKQIIRRLNVANRTQAALLAARTAGPAKYAEAVRR